MSDKTSNLIRAEEGTPLLPSRKGQEEKHAVVPVGSSSVSATVFNLTNSIVGAGCIALGSAIGESGGLVSIVAILLVAVLNKYSFDLVIDLSRDVATSAAATASGKKSTPATTASYESLGHNAYGSCGRTVVAICKLVYGYG